MGLGSIFSRFSLVADIAVDLGTANTLVYAKNLHLYDDLVKEDDATTTICNLENKDFNISFVPRPHYENSFYTSPQNSNFNYNIMINKNGSAISQINANNISSVTYLEQNQIADFNTPQTAIDYNVSPAIVF